MGLSRRHLLTAAGLSLSAAACGSNGAPAGSPTATTPGPASPTPTATGLDETALRRKVASLLVVGFRGQTVSPDDWIVKAIRGQHIGGVILFDTDQLTGQPRNITSPEQVTKLVTSLREAAPGPLIVSIDQEGGRISRLNPGNGFPASQSQAQVGAINQAAHTTAWAQGMVRSLTSVGVTMNYAPVVDLATNPNNPAIAKLGRSFSADADVVVANATEEIKVHRASKIKTSIKHFPGFGSATGNTDFDVVDVTGTWKRSDLVPFQRLIAAGTADSVLVAHLLNRQLDPDKPMSLSRKAVNDLLRGDLGWTGPVVSDDMQAKGITAKYGTDEAFTLAVQAGVDLLVYANQQVYNPRIVTEILDVAVNRVKRGDLTMAQIDAAVARVDTLRP
ncbi:beta-N-acetylhexosaminidase [Hamadaea flava]|uniref:Glycoside hydrolase family 3 N-terminal domain-containing protein n=1 Tax=Hamadaea flava TaxID=1742688 RepID=A0ABV8LYN5_9ACTN|nr:glycoside hydrolase family 3 N-terminal domain-containing protein [Hamadaea flava]MCP2322115.1 beta-N-acetylhexosaminidase [Hamadaea flava]